jgi:hypothetical protein
LIKPFCKVRASGEDPGNTVICWLEQGHSAEEHYDKFLGIYWRLAEGPNAGDREPRRDKDGDELAARRRLYRDRREEEAPSTLAWSA